MFASTSYKGLCPFLYPPATRQYAFQASARMHSRAARTLSTSCRRLNNGRQTSTTASRAPPPHLSKASGSASHSPTSSAAPTGSTVPPQGVFKTPSPAEALTRSKPEEAKPTDRVPPEYEGEQHIKERQAQMPLRFLDRPLGLPSPPTTKPRTWQEVRDDLLDAEKRMKERQHLVKQVLTGYYDDVHQLKYHGGKRWTAPEVLVKADKALYFPDIVGTPLSDSQSVHTTDICKGKISILCIIGSQMGEKHVEDFTRLALESFGDDPDLRFVQINLQENPLKAFLVSMFTSRIKKQVPEKYHPYYLLSSHNMEYYREPLGCTNKMLGYVYLLDEDLKVRWAGGGHPNPEEQVSLHRCTGVLLKRLKEKHGRPLPPSMRGKAAAQ